MLDYLSRAGKTILIVILTVSALSIAVRFSKKPKEIYIQVQDPNYVQNIGEAQQRLKEQGLYHGKIDYIWGPLMDKAYCDYCAIEAIKGK